MQTSIKGVKGPLHSMDSLKHGGDKLADLLDFNLTRQLVQLPQDRPQLNLRLDVAWSGWSCCSACCCSERSCGVGFGSTEQSW